MKKHLIIGYGSMGFKHGKILNQLGQTYDVLDIVPDLDLIAADEIKHYKDVSHIKWNNYLSVLICTPPDTHISILDKVQLDIPVFIEKPIIVENVLTNYITPRRAPTFVACNYRFCKEYWESDIRFIEYGYLCKGPFSYLDLIHMVDLCWEKYSVPEFGNISSFSNIHNLIMGFNPNRFVTVVGNNQSPIKYSRLNGKEETISNEMFLNQMSHWLDVVKGRSVSTNPVSTALERTKWLIGLKNV